MAFEPERLAQLHNQLLQKAIQHGSATSTERTVYERFLEVTEVDDSFADQPIGRFLRLIETTPQQDGTMSGVFTPMLYQPDPTLFWGQNSIIDPEYVLLYPQNNADSPADGGIYISTVTGGVIYLNNALHSPTHDQLIPLETFYKIQIHQWSTEKYYFDSEAGELSVRWWRDADVDKALTSWEKLLSAIEARMSSQPGQRLEPLATETLDRFKISRFARQFLSRAVRPAFAHIAPGLSTFTTETWLQIYGCETRDSRRLTTSASEEVGQISTLLFPSNETVPESVSSDTNFEVKSFDEDWGFGKFTVARNAGLYIDGLDFRNAGVVRLIHTSGLSSIISFATNCPWGFGRDPSLAEVLQKWTWLVENDKWQVDETGVCTSGSWFRSHSSEAKLSWHDVMRDQIGDE